MGHLRRVDTVEPALKKLSAERSDDDGVAVTDFCDRASYDFVFFGVRSRNDEREKKKEKEYKNNFFTASQAGSSQSVPCPINYSINCFIG